MTNKNEEFDIDLFVDDYIENKLSQNRYYIEISYNDLLEKNKLPKQYINEFFELAKRDLEADWYSVYKEGSKYIYNNKEYIVSSDKVLIAIKR